MACLVVVAYLVGRSARSSWASETGATAAWFPAAGVGVIALLVAPRPRWPVTLVGP